MRNTLLLALAVGIGILSLSAQERGRSLLTGMAVQEPNLIIHGAYLHRIEVWAFLSGTNITPAEFFLLGKANQLVQRVTTSVGFFHCLHGIPPATEIFVRAFDARAKPIGKKSLWSQRSV